MDIYTIARYKKRIAVPALPFVIIMTLLFLWSCENESGINKIGPAPAVRTTNPANNATDVAVNNPITVAFNDAMDPGSISGTTFIVRNDTATVAGKVSYADSMATFMPSEDLNYNSDYSATVTTDVRNLSGNNIEQNYEWSFTTADFAPKDSEAPQVVSTSPENNAEDISVNTTVSVTFSEPMNESTINSSSFSMSQGQTLIDGTVSYEDAMARFAPTNPLAFGTTYTIVLTSSVEDTAGNALGNDLTWNFSTENNPDNTPPAITDTEPADNEDNVAPNTTITATFSEPMDPATINSSSFTLEQGNTGIRGTVSYSGNRATFAPAGELSFGTAYTATVIASARDLAGNTIANDVSWRFTTGSEPDNIAPEVTDIDPAAGQSDVPVNSNITATFSEPVDASTVNSSTFTVNQDGTPVSGSISYSGLTAIFNPSNNLPFGAELEAEINTGVQDLAGNSMTSDFNWSFTTVQEKTPPTIASTNPADNARNIAVETTISVTFSEPMDPASINKSTFVVSEDDEIDDDQINGTISYSGSTATFMPSRNLSFEETYTAFITTGAKDQAGNNLQNSYSWSFTTSEEPDRTPPEVTSISPADNQTDVGVTTIITATFSEAMESSSINSQSFSVTANGSSIGGSVSYEGTTATFNPSSNLPYGTIFSATVTTAAEDLAGNNLSNNVSWSFATEKETTPPKVSSTNPADNETDVSTGSIVTVTFNEAMDGATLNNNTFTLSQGITPVDGSVSYNSSSNTATFNPSVSLDLGTTYTASVTTGAKDLAGNALADDVFWNFTTEQESTPPAITSVTPDDGASGVAVSTNITATFSEAMDGSTITSSTFRVTQNGNTVNGSVSYANNKATFNPNNNLAFDATVTATITTDVTDLAGNKLTSNESWTFTTEQESIPPTVTSTDPTNNEENVKTNTAITATFSEDMESSTINSNTFRVTLGGSAIAGDVSYSGRTAIFSPDDNLPFASTITATITTGAQDLVGNALESNVTWSFTTEQESTPPEVITTNPTNGESDVTINSDIIAQFSESMDPSTIDKNSFTVTQDGKAVSGKVSYSETTATFDPSSELAYGSTVTARISTQATDLAGNNLSGEYTWSFTTEQESIPPEVSSTNPLNDAVDISSNSTVTATFSESMDETTINETTFTLSQGGTAVSGTVSYDGNSNTATFKPSDNLALGTPYTATVTTGAKDLAGNALTDDYSWSFTTEKESVPPEVTSVDPPDGAINIATDIEITATFSEELDPSTVSSSTFSLDDNGTLISGSVSYSGTTATFTPDNNLPLGSTLTATITTGVKDLAGNSLTADKVWNFTTQPASDSSEADSSEIK